VNNASPYLGILMDDLQRLVAIEDIRRLKTRYWNGFDFKDAALLRSAFADEVLIDYRVKVSDPKISPLVFCVTALPHGPYCERNAASTESPAARM
jgi:hypothetical protein